jgi:WD40 repeat protein
VIAQWTVARSEELGQVIAAVLATSGDDPVGITTGLQGAGGFGKTTLARQVCADERVRNHFAGGVYFVTIGREVRGSAAIALKVKDAIHFVTGQNVTYTDPDMAGDELGRLLDKHLSERALLVLDDVWEPEQLDPFLRGGRKCVRLVTTRVPSVLPDSAVRVPVDQMTWDQARRVLCHQLPPLPRQLTDQLIKATGRWPLLLRLANAVLTKQTTAGADPAEAAAALLGRLRAKGPAALDFPSPTPDLDPADSKQRSLLVRATMRAAIDLLTAREQRCLAGLGIFAEDEPIPVTVAAELWQATEGLEVWDARQLCCNLSSRSLLDLAPNDGGVMALHDVIRDYLRHELGRERIAELNASLADAVAARLNRAEPLAASIPGPSAAWWTLAADENAGGRPGDRYLARHAIAHLLAANRTEQAEALAFDIRWVEARLRQQGPAAPWSDCNGIPTPAAASRARDLAQAAHLLARTEPGHALITVLHSRLAALTDWRDQVTVRQRQLTQPALRNLRPPPDLPHPALVRVIPGHTARVRNVLIAPNSAWLATTHEGGTVRIWDKATGTQTATLTGHSMGVRKVAIAADSTWLATTDGRGRARIWDPVTGAQTGTLAAPVTEAVIAPDSTWLATTDNDGTVRIWDKATGTQTAALAGHGPRVRKVVIAPDSTWLASSHENGSVCIWDKGTGTRTGTLASRSGHLHDLAIAPDGSRVTTTDYDGTVRVWDPVTGAETTAAPISKAMTVEIAPDSGWVVTTHNDGTVHISNMVTGDRSTTLAGQHGWHPVLVIAPDGRWFITIDRGELHIFDHVAGTMTRAVPSSRVTALAVAPGSDWFATTHENGTARIWDKATGTETALTGHNNQLRKMTIAPDSTWLATTDYDGTVRIWDKATGSQAIALTGKDRNVRRVPIAPDSTWAAISYKNGTVRIWDRITGTETPLRRPSSTLEIAPDSSWLATAASDGSVCVWDRATGTETTLAGQTSWLYDIAIAPDSTWLAITHERPTSSLKQGEVRIWDRATGTEANLTGHNRMLLSAIAPNSAWLATADSDGTVRIWDPAAGTQTDILASRGWPIKMAIAPDSTWLMTSHQDGAVCVWDIATATQVAALTDDDERARDARIAPGSDWLVITGANGDARVWEKTTGAQVPLTTQNEGIYGLVIAPDSNWLAFTDRYGSAHVWSVATGIRTTLTDFYRSVRSVTIGPDSTWLTTAHEDGTVGIWDMNADAYAVLTSQATAVAIAPDGTRLATTHENGEVRIWDRASRRVLTMMRTDGIPRSCAWMPDGAGLVVHGNQGLYFYEFHPGHPARR